MTAVITEAQRFEMHTCLRGLMGDEVANTMMEHLPPSGWSDVARQSDIALVRGDLDQAKVVLKSDIALVKAELKSEINLVRLGLEHLGKNVKGLKIVIGSLIPVMVAGFIGLYSALVSKL